MKMKTIVMILIGLALILASIVLSFGAWWSPFSSSPLDPQAPLKPNGSVRAPVGPTLVENNFLRLALSLDQSVVSPEDLDAWLQMQVSAPQDAATRRTPVSVTLVLDASGSMAGNKIANARQAAHRFIDQLAEGDVLSVVGFDTSVTTHLSGFVVGFDRTMAHGAVDRIQAGGGTCISCGLQTAYSLLSDAGAGRLRRVILLSDGNANTGISDVGGLGRLASSYLESMSIATATIGLGQDHDEQMLSAIAVAGAANYYFLHNSGYLAQILDRELAALSRTAILELTIELSPADGVILERPSHPGVRQEGTSWVLSVGQLAAGEERTYLVPLRLPQGDLSTVVSARAVFTPINQTKQELSVQAHMERSEDPVRVADSTDPKVVERQVLLTSVAQIEEAMDAYESGQRDQAYRILQINADQLRDASARLGGSVTLSQEVEDTEQLLQVLPAAAEGSREARGNVMFNRARSADVLRGQSREDAYHQNGMYDLSTLE